MADTDRRTALCMMAGMAAAASAPGESLAGATRALSARRLYRDAIVIDGNLMAPINPDARLNPTFLAQVRSSGLTALKMTLGGSGQQSKADVDASIVAVNKGIAASKDVYAKVRAGTDIALAKRSGRVGIIYSFEAADMLEGNVDTIDHFRAQDVLVMGLSYNGLSPFASGILAPIHSGLSPLGREAVARMNALGVTVDLSHSDETSSLAALSASTKPVVISHAGCAAIHEHPRNKSDHLLRSLADRGGVVGVFELSYLTAPPAQPTLADYLVHLTHALKKCGEDHVGIGTDGLLTPFDTSPASMRGWYEEIARRKAAGVGAPGEGPPPFAIGLNRPDRSQVIADALLKRGYASRVVEKVLGLNFQRAFAETWRSARA